MTDIKATECLKALQVVNKFLDDECASCNDIVWRDRFGESFSGDMGYLFEGLESFETYLKNRLQRSNEGDKK